MKETKDADYKVLEKAMALDEQVHDHVKYVHMMVDEMWNPLQVVNGYLESFETENLTADQKEEIETIKNNVELIEKVVRELTNMEEILREDFDKLFYVK